MLFFNISLSIVSTFLFLLPTLFVGIYFSKKQTTFLEYAIGNKQFGTATLVAAVLGTLYGGGALIRNIEGIYGYGLSWIMLVSSSPFSLWIISKLALRMGPFMSHLSLAETIGNVYGKYPRIIAALIGICSCMVIMIIQIKVISQVIGICCSWVDPRIVTLLVTLLLIFYATFGGIRAITFTNVLQCITFTIIIPLMSWFIFLKLAKPITGIFATLSIYDTFQIKKVLQLNTSLLSNLLLVLSLIISNIDQTIMQRVYMASGPGQVRKVFTYATFFNIFISSFILFIGLCTFISAPHLPKEAIWDYIVESIPIGFKGFLCICLFSMAISTADSSLNCCSVMVSHDILKYVSNKKDIFDRFQLKVARLTTLVLGLFSTLLAFSAPDLVALMYWFIDCVVPIVPAPFILAIFGFRGTTRTALTGMAVGLVTILIWNIWIEPLTGIHGAFLAMIANGLAMMAVHYLFKQPETTGWVEPDNIFKQSQQESSRRYAEQKEYFKTLLDNRKKICAKIVPQHKIILLAGLYLIIFNWLGYFIQPTLHNAFCLVIQWLLGTFFVIYPSVYNLKKDLIPIPKWTVGLIWLITFALYLPYNVIWQLSNGLEPIGPIFLCLTHCFIILSLLPIYCSIIVLTITLLLATYPIYIGPAYPLSALLPLLMLAIVVCWILICIKIKLRHYTNQIIYLKDQEKFRAIQQIKASLYEAEIVPFNSSISTKGYAPVLKEVVRKVEQSISFLDNDKPLFKEDFQTIINKFYDWIDYFKRKEKAKNYALLQTTKIPLDKLIRKVEMALYQQMTDPPGILVQKMNNNNQKLSPRIICDVNQIVYALVKSILTIAKLPTQDRPIITIQLQPTAFQFKQANAIDNSYPQFISFKAIAILITSSTTAPNDIPEIKNVYSDLIDTINTEHEIKKEKAQAIDLDKETIDSIVRAHYGYIEQSHDQKTDAILMVLPVDVTHILDNINVELPLDTFSQETSMTLQEEADAMVILMKFHDDFCKYLNQESPTELKMISQSILLLRKYFRFKRHASGKLLYVRAVAIAQLVAEWAFQYHKVICAALLYELVRHNCLPLSYIKTNYNIGIYGFVSNLVKIDKHQDLDHPSLLYVQNRFEKAIKENNVQVSVLCIKLAERLYDLQHAASYSNPKEIAYMAQETLAIDVQIANTYLDANIATQLQKAAEEALKICSLKR